MLQQPVVQAPCRRLVVAAPVIDKDATGHNILGVCSIAPHVARENSMEASAIRAQQRPQGDPPPRSPPIFAYSDATGKSSVRANGCSDFQRYDTADHEIAKHGYPTENYSSSTLTARRSPHARRVTKVTFYVRGFSRFVTSTTARTAHVQVGSEAIPWQPIFLNRCSYTTKRCQR
jgi:hypothetical protein